MAAVYSGIHGQTPVSIHAVSAFVFVTLALAQLPREVFAAKPQRNANAAFTPLASSLSPMDALQAPRVSPELVEELKDWINPMAELAIAVCVHMPVAVVKAAPHKTTGQVALAFVENMRSENNNDTDESLIDLITAYRQRQR